MTLLSEEYLLPLLLPIYRWDNKGRERRISCFVQCNKDDEGQTWDPTLNFHWKFLTLLYCMWRSKISSPGFSSALNSVFLNKVQSWLVFIRHNGLSFRNSWAPAQRCQNAGICRVSPDTVIHFGYNDLRVQRFYKHCIYLPHQEVPGIYLVSKLLLKNFWGKLCASEEVTFWVHLD